MSPIPTKDQKRATSARCRFFHWLFGCTPGKFVGRGHGVYGEKKNRPVLYTQKQYDFYECAVCGGQVVREV